MRVRWSQRSLQYLRAIGAFIAQDNPGGARRWVARLQDRARRAAPVPYSGRKVPEVEREDIREVFLSSYRILYQVFPDHIETRRWRRGGPDLLGVELEALRNLVVLADGLDEEPSRAAKQAAILLQTEKELYAGTCVSFSIPLLEESHENLDR